MVILVAEPGDILLEPGTYPATIVDIAVRDRDHRRFLVWTFAIEHGGNRATVRRPSGMSLAPGSMARAIVEAALGRKLRPNERIDTADLVGQRVLLTIVRATRADGTPFNRVEGVRPAQPDDDYPF